MEVLRKMINYTDEDVKEHLKKCDSEINIFERPSIDSSKKLMLMLEQVNDKYRQLLRDKVDKMEQDLEQHF